MAERPAASPKPTATLSPAQPSVALSEHAKRLLGIFAFTLGDETGTGVLHWRKNSDSWKTDKVALRDLVKAGFIVHLESSDTWDVYYKITEAGKVAAGVDVNATSGTPQTTRQYTV